jgi:hypothetical protein
MIMAAATYRHIPNIIVLGNGKTISLIENAAPESTLTILGWALLIGCIFILPFLFYLMFSFTKAKNRNTELIQIWISSYSFRSLLICFSAFSACFFEFLLLLAVEV